MGGTMWTEDQQKAIAESGKNIIVSAGAGSGKTAVLSERVLTKVLSGVHVNELLILTFTKAAAAEMKERIRKKLVKEKLMEEVSLIDSAYITTFDSFALSIVKKYHDVINVTDQVAITDEVVLDLKRREILEEILNQEYFQGKESFCHLMKDFTLKTDDEFIRLLLKIDKKIDMRTDKKEYLKHYIDHHFSDHYLSSQTLTFESLLLKDITDMKELIRDLSLMVDGDYIEKLTDVLAILLQARTYEDIVKGLDCDRLPNLPRGTEDEAKEQKEAITKKLKELKETCIWSDKGEMKDELLSTKENTSEIVRLLLKLNHSFLEYKFKNDYYSFNDIAKLAIDIVKENKEIQEELKSKFHEILIDEYQDTSDIQEKFISLIEHDNVYMVGDIKQSIYRFRNANPYIFKNKYDRYALLDGGMKIDLTKNFRSRREVLENINVIFDEIMDDFIGGADYKKSHRLVFGNKTYEDEGKTEQDYNLSILNYQYDKQDSINKEEYEAFIIAKDIKQKIENQYKIFDKDTKEIRPVHYSDFVILMGRYRHFDLYKKVFEYLEIPLKLSKDEDIKKDIDVLVIKNIIKCILCIYKKQYNEEFRYAFLSIGRSFLYRMSDEILFECFKNDRFYETDIFKKCSDLSKDIDHITASELFYNITQVFSYEEKMISLGNVYNYKVRMEYFYNLFKSFEERGETIEDFGVYLDQILDSDYNMKFSVLEKEEEAVEVMTIFKSKGLEFPICYFPDLNATFNLRELNDKILYDNHYGIVLPKVDDFIKPTIYKKMIRREQVIEEISERLRLFYVALTRAKEHMILVMPKTEEYIELKDKVPDYIRSNYKSFYEVICSVLDKLSIYQKEVKIDINKDYLLSSKTLEFTALKNIDELIVDEFHYEQQFSDVARFSKKSLELTTPLQQKNMDYGNAVHEVLEFIDFDQPQLDTLDINNSIKECVQSFLDSKLMNSLKNPQYFHEYEFMYTKDQIDYHGMIDLLIEDTDQVIIIDYKLKKIEDSAYQKQLDGYYHYMKTKTDKNIKVYLYSILDRIFKEVVIKEEVIR